MRIAALLIITGVVLSAQQPASQPNQPTNKPAVDPMKLTLPEKYALNKSSQEVKELEDRLAVLQQQVSEAKQLRDLVGQSICGHESRKIVGSCRIDGDMVIAPPPAARPVVAKPPAVLPAAAKEVQKP